MFKVCLAGTYPVGTFEAITKALSPDRFAVFAADTQEKFDAVTDADVVILRILKMPAESFARFTNLKMVMRWGVGYDSVDIEQAGRRGILVCNTPGANAYAVAELAVGLMIDVGRNIGGYGTNIQKGVWDRNFFPFNYSLNKKTVGLIGCGNIGRQVAMRVQAFGARVQYYDTFPMSEENEKEYGMTYTDLDSLLESSDVISLHVPLLDSTRHIIGAQQLRKMKPSAILINTARGGLLDDNALLNALQDKQLFGAGLDCVENENSSVTNALSKMTNVIITPHIGGTSSDLGGEIIPMLLDNITRLQEGKEVLHVVNHSYLEKRVKQG